MELDIDQYNFSGNPRMTFIWQNQNWRDNVRVLEQTFFNRKDKLYFENEIQHFEIIQTVEGGMHLLIRGWNKFAWGI